MPARVREDEEQRPVALLEREPVAVASIDDRVEEEGEWWEPKLVWKMHYQVTLEDGLG